MLDKFEKFNHRLSSWCEWLGLAAILLMMVITCIDVVGAKLFLSPLLGAIDIVQLSQIVAISFAAGMAMILGRHVQVEFFYNLFPRRAQLSTVHRDYLAPCGAGSFLSKYRRVYGNRLHTPVSLRLCGCLCLYSGLFDIITGVS